MNSIDLIAIFGNLSQSLYPLQRLISAIAYLLGVLFFITAITKLKKMVAQGHAGAGASFTPMMYLLFGAVLIYLPTGLSMMANTAFGTNNILTYSDFNSNNIFQSIGLLIRTAGLAWFVRGCVLVAHSSEPGAQHGPKGMLFLIAGVLAINFDNTVAMLNTLMGNMSTWAITFKTYRGY